MKKMLIALLLLVCLSVSAAAETFTAPGAFTLECPSGWEIDLSQNEDYSEPEDGYYFFGYLVGSDMILELDMEDWRDVYDDFSLYHAKEDEIASYRADIEEDFQEAGVAIEYLGVFDDNPRQIPFLLFYVPDEEFGEYYYVDTISGGWCVMMYYYTYYEDDVLSEKNLEELKEILSSFQPIL